MKEVLTVEEKGHDVDSTTYLQYIQNKALFSADTLECSAVFVRPSEQNYRLYNHTAICEVISHFIKQKKPKLADMAYSLLKLHPRTHRHARMHTHSHLHCLSWLFERLGCLIPS